MAPTTESPRRKNVMQGLNSLGAGFSSIVSRDPSPLSPLSPLSQAKKSALDEARAIDRGSDQSEKKLYQKVPRRWDSFGKEKRSPELMERASPFASPFTSPKLKSPNKTQNLFAFSENQKTREHGNTLPQRRKNSVSDLLLEKMTTVQEYPMDSPTIPGRPPAQPSSQISPELVDQRSPTSTNRGSLTPRAMTSAPNLKHDDEDKESRLEVDSGRSIRRASSVLLPRGLAPLVIPSHEQCLLPAEAYRPSDLLDDEELPPKVPPKSPRMLSRAFPQSAKTTPAIPQSSRTTPVPATPISACSSTTTLHSASTSLTSIGSLDDLASSKPWSAPILSAGFQTASPENNQRGFNAANERTSQPPWSAKEFRTNSPRPVRHGMSVDETSTAKPLLPLRSGKITPEPLATGHQSGVSENSVMNRGRPTKKVDSLQRILSKTAHSDKVTRFEYADLPFGVRNTKATTSIPFDELRRLKKHAEASAATFRILREAEVSDLSQELQILNDRCEFLRKTYDSLREGRRGLYKRKVAYLSALRSAAFTTEHVVKQEDALVELDVSIDEWSVKLEQAQDRRNKIRQKLLEHVTAISMVKLPGTSRDQVSVDAQTPPRSPEKVDRSFSTERRDVESIRVYADSGVASLLASIEKELGMMEEQGRFDS
ncbi:hypothetical protein MMC13_005146 [Lambiella insularis]|nr:hypothetical protein [Lambiella insularis]